MVLAQDSDAVCDNHARVSALNKELREVHGIKTWFDEDRLESNIKAEMAKGVEASKKVVVVVTQRYMDKVNSEDNDNCKFEFKLAKSQRQPKNMIPVVEEPRMKDQAGWKLVFGATLGRHLYTDYCDNKDLKKVAAELAEMIKE